MIGRRSRSSLVLFLALTAGLSFGAMLAMTGAARMTRMPATATSAPR